MQALLGGGAGMAGAAPMAGSSNVFANGANQNAGNVMTDRPTTRIHHGPGGATSIYLGHDEPARPSPPQKRPPAVAARVGGEGAPAAGVATGGGRSGSSNVFANGANQNAGNVITDRSSTRVRYGPGGATSICLGADDGAPKPAAIARPAVAASENTNSLNLPGMDAMAPDKPRARASPTTTSQIVFG
mmetsp:Transcript_57893/g.167801  ORF Transcript_57893/g.167801 Transcript_57893/m.167801 type:complete len:188 (+) Transcript_57893:86-649(+)